MSQVRLIQGSAHDISIASASVQCIVTSPPYWGLRKYAGEQGIEWPAVEYSPMPGLTPLRVPDMQCDLGLEPSPEAYIGHMVLVLRELWRVLRDDGTLWLNAGDSFEAKQLAGIPWRLALAAQADGWYLRSDIIWHKKNAMPESVTDRPTKAHEYIFLLAKSKRYYYDHEAIKVPAVKAGQVLHSYDTGAKDRKDVSDVNDRRTRMGLANWDKPVPETRNRRDVWTVNTKPYPDSHFAVFPPDLIEPCILAGSAEGDTVLDPFHGSGTTGHVAVKHRRNYIGVDISEEYLTEHDRINGTQVRLI